MKHEVVGSRRERDRLLAHRLGRSDVAAPGEDAGAHGPEANLRVAVVGQPRAWRPRSRAPRRPRRSGRAARERRRASSPMVERKPVSPSAAKRVERLPQNGCRGLVVAGVQLEHLQEHAHTLGCGRAFRDRPSRSTASGNAAGRAANSPEYVDMCVSRIRPSTDRGRGSRAVRIGSAANHARTSLTGVDPNECAAPSQRIASRARWRSPRSSASRCERVEHHRPTDGCGPRRKASGRATESTAARSAGLPASLEHADSGHGVVDRRVRCCSEPSSAR